METQQTARLVTVLHRMGVVAVAVAVPAARVHAVARSHGMSVILAVAAVAPQAGGV